MDEPKLRIDELYAFISEGDEGEGLTAAFDPFARSWLPMVCADQQRVDAVRHVVQRIATASGKSVKLVRFSLRSEIETINPQ